MHNQDSKAGATHPRPWRGAFFVLGLLLGLAAGALSARYWLQSEASKQYNTMRQQMQLELDRAHGELNNARAQVDAMTGKLVVEESTRKGLEASLQSTQAELGRARDQLAFFDQLLPPGPKGAISIRALEVERLGPTLQYKVLLMRNAQDGELFKGHMQFVAAGVWQDGKADKITLRAVFAPGASDESGPDPGAASQAASDTGEFALSFEEFQRSGGLLGIPDGFIPKTVTANVLEGNTVRVSRTVTLAADGQSDQAADSP